jgi:hypothetical protein
VPRVAAVETGRDLPARSLPAQSGVARHLALIAAVTALAALAMLYPFLPGDHDPVAGPLSTLIQLVGAAGLLLVPVAGPWLWYETRRRGRIDPNRRHAFARATLATGAVAVVLVTLPVRFAVGAFAAVLTLVVSTYLFVRCRRRLRRLRLPAAAKVNPAPLYLTALPVVMVLLQILLAGPAVESSRDRAMARGQELIDAIERHRATYGRYPESLAAVYPDYHTSVVGIDRFQYARSGEAYNVYFEQPRFLFDVFGTREFVVYNPRDDHVLPSHAAAVLEWPADRVATRQGWYAVHRPAGAHWVTFWFD